ncbi:hypothetical protein [Spirillospora sp. NPDC047279]|uniref:hypothetical protein n=1 Tax=Spirillospora sp. NPDC047279 TaxID=3155478 RepID=UPI0034020DCB
MIGAVLGTGLLWSVVACSGGGAKGEKDPVAAASAAVQKLMVCRLADFRPLLKLYNGSYVRPPLDVLGEPPGRYCRAYFALSEPEQGSHDFPDATDADARVAVVPFKSAQAATTASDQAMATAARGTEDDRAFQTLSGPWSHGRLFTGSTGRTDVVVGLIRRDALLVEISLTSPAGGRRGAFTYSRAELAATVQQVLTSLYTAVTTEIET